MRTINIVGAGHVGQTLGALFHRGNVFTIKGVCNRSIASARDAVAIIDAGPSLSAVGVTSIEELPKADVHLISTGDDSIASACVELAASVNLSGSIVLHCSGSLPSSLLDAARNAGALVASVHPIKSFASVENSIESFGGTFCGVEGDDVALSVLEPAFAAIGGRTFRIDPNQKTLYHAAFVFSMNYFIAIVEVGLRCYEKAGVSRELALQLLQPILTGAATNVTTIGPVGALTGPIARGDVGVVKRQLDALGEWDPKLRSLYSALGEHAVSLSALAGNAAEPDLQAIRQLFDDALS